jgi:hypothetical protein
MSAITIAGDTSGSVTLDAPAVAGTTVLTLPATSGAVLTTTSPKVGNVLQVVSNDSSSVGTFTTTSTTPVDTGYSISITPSSTSSKIAIFFNPLLFIENAVSKQVFVYAEAHLYRGTTQLKSRAISVNTGSTLLVDMSGTVSTFFLDSPNTTNTVTYRLYINSLAHAFITSINSVGGFSNITLMEIAG